MAIQFGVGTLYVLTNNLLTGGVVTTGSSGVPTQNIQVSSGLVMIDGITAVLSAGSASFAAAGNTGNGLLAYAYIASGDTVTATIGIVSASHPINTATNIPTAICPLARFDFGTASNAIGNIVVWSGGSATKTIAKVQNVSINVSYENAQMRGGGDVYPVDTQFFDGKCEGNFEFSDQTATQLLLIGGIYASGGASGTWTLSAVSKPESVSLVFQNVTNGITSTYSIMRAYLSQSTNDFSRTDYLTPSYDFISQANNQGTVLKVQQ